MCGRFTQKYTWEELHRLYRLRQPARNVRPQYNICPTDPVDVVIRGDAGLFVVPMRWQLMPPWWTKSRDDLPATSNAGAETVAEKPMFRDAFKRTRCVIPASGYYEWQTAACPMRRGGNGRPLSHPGGGRSAVTLLKSAAVQTSS